MLSPDQKEQSIRLLLAGAMLAVGIIGVVAVFRLGAC